MSDLEAEIVALEHERDQLVGRLAIAEWQAVAATEALDAAREALDRAQFQAKSAKVTASQAALVLARHEVGLREARAELAALRNTKGVE